MYMYMYLGRQSSLLVVFVMLCDKMSSRGSRLLMHTCKH